MTKRSQPRQFRGSSSDRELLAVARRNGYACTALLPDPPQTPVGWTYTVGLCVARFPELVIADMPAQKAIVYIASVAQAMLLQRLALRTGDDITMFDGSSWHAFEQLPKATHYGVPSALRLYGERQQVRAVRLVPPPELAWVPGTIWPGYTCECGCAPTDDPLAAIRHQVGTRFLR